ncbi:MAG: glyoxalase/bleomycin resistance/dioxygenase family protein [Myxococcales bacterium]|nr:MAG: glyoxalase/bleomycin resistance/dioxygenase family protein [Myxococcales bacterium]
MKRIHIHVGVENLEQAIQFYSALFGVKPSKSKSDYAKWMLEDPKLNFAISTRANVLGVDHLGIQAEDASELEAMREQAEQAGLALRHEGESVCCYARSEKSWLTDPSGVAWETYQTMEDAELFSSESHDNSACCMPKTKKQSSCC